MEDHEFMTRKNSEYIAVSPGGKKGKRDIRMEKKLQGGIGT